MHKLLDIFIYPKSSEIGPWGNTTFLTFLGAKGVIRETGNIVDIHKLTLCCKGGYATFFVLLDKGGLYMRGVISELLGYLFCIIFKFLCCYYEVSGLHICR